MTESHVFATHNGVYHLDDVFAAAILLGVYPDATFIRSRDEAVYNTADLVFDVGHGPYDHHFNGAETRPDGTIFSACGLIWRDFGRHFLKANSVPYHLIEDIWQEWDRLVTLVDRHDNGQGTELHGDLTIVSIVSTFNGSKSFEDMAKFVNEFMVAKTINMKNFHRDSKIVKDAIAARTRPDVLEIPHGTMWQTVVLRNAPDVDFIIYENSDTTWRVVCVPTTLGGFVCKKPLPEFLRGRSKEELREKTEMSITFVHNSGFTGATETREDVIRLIDYTIEQS